MISKIHTTHVYIYPYVCRGRIVCMKLSPNLQCRKQADDSADFAFLDDDGEDSVKPAHRSILPVEEQIDLLHDALKHPY